MKQNKKSTTETRRSAVTIAIANHKGGVAKTTSTLTIGSILAKRGSRVLLVDLDAQSNLTLSLLREDADYTSIYDAISGGSSELPIVSIKKNIDLVPSSLNLTQLELSMMGILQREYIIADKLKPYLDQYDYILIDCPPALGIFTVNALVAADYALIPMTAEVLPYKGLTSLITLIAQISDRLNTRLSVLGILFTKYKANTNLTKNIETAVTEVFGPLLLENHVRDATKVAEAPIERASLVDYAPKSQAAKDYERVVDEILERMASENGKLVK